MKYVGLIAIIGLLAGCSGGGGGNGPLPVARSTSASQTQTRVVIKIPSSSSTSGSSRRKPEYVSPGTQSVSLQLYSATSTTFPVPSGTTFQAYGSPVTANLTSGSPNCEAVSGGTQCTLNIFYPIQADTYWQLVGTMYSGLNETGNALSSALAIGGYGTSNGFHSGAIGNANVLYLTMGGVVDHWVASVPAVFTLGTASSETLTIAAYDADGYQIAPSPSDASECGPATSPVPGTISQCDPWEDGAGGEQSLSVQTLTGTGNQLNFQNPSGAGSTCFAVGMTLPQNAGFNEYGPSCNATLVYTGAGNIPITIQASDENIASGTTTTGSAVFLNPFLSTSLTATIPAPPVAP